MNRKTDSAAKGLLADDRGAVFLWTLFVALPVFFALGAVVVDAHRTYNTFDEAQSFADHTALAAAMELNGQPGAIDRAIKAACGSNPGPLVTGFHTYGNAAVSGARALAADRLVFLSGLGPDPMAPDQYVTDNDPIPICTATCAAPGTCQNLGAGLNGQARFVSVTTAPVTVSWLLAPVMNAFGMNVGASADAAARATAGFSKAVCNWAPLFICKPNGNLTKGMQIKAKEGGPNFWGPGDYGLLEAIDSNGGKKDFLEAVASLYPSDHCTDNTVELESGSGTGPVEKGFNVRFDIFDSNTKKWKNDKNFPPAQNVTKGRYTKKGEENCDPDNKNDSGLTAMPRDACFSGGACSASGPRFGNGDWNCGAYWLKNHGSATCPLGAGATRFDLYKYEINNTIPNNTLEKGWPTCSNQSWTPPSGQLDRREFIIAVLDCNNLNKNGPNTVLEYARMFLTEPVGLYNPSDKDIFMEYIGPGNSETLSDVFKEYPVLYR